MAAKKQPVRRRATVTLPIDDEDLDLTPDEDLDLKEDLEIEDVIAQFRGAITRVYIFRKTREGDIESLESLAPEGVSPEMLRENYGPGKYILKFRASDGKFKKHVSINIGVLKPQQGTSSQTSGSPELIHLRESNERTFQLLLATINANKGPDLTGLAALIAACNGGGKGQDLNQVLAAFSSLKTITEPKNALADIKAAVELARELNPGTTEETGFTVVKEIAQKAIDAFSGGREEVAPALPAARQPAAGVDAQEQKPMMSRSNTEKWIRAQLEYFKMKAAAGKDVEFWIDYVFENQDEPGNSAILSAMEQGVTFEQILQFDPSLQPHTEWFKALYDGIRAQLVSDGVITERPNGKSHMDSVRPGGNQDHAPDNAQPGTGGTGGS